MSACINRVKLISIMAERRMSSIELSASAGISRSTITAVRNGKSCNEKTLGKIAAALGLDVAELLEEAGA